MPEGPPREEMGEGSEGWSDFYGSVRPRHVDSDDVRDALWATDEFESDEVRCCKLALCAEQRLCWWGGCCCRCCCLLSDALVPGHSTSWSAGRPSRCCLGCSSSMRSSKPATA